MPMGNGMGPSGQGPGTGRGMGRGRGKGRMGGNLPGSGPQGDCRCLKCNLSVPHNAGIPCYDMKCPKCGGAMVRE